MTWLTPTAPPIASGWQGRKESLSTVSGPYCYEHAARRCAQLNASASPPGMPRHFNTEENHGRPMRP